MANGFTWGGLTKSPTDGQMIEEAIAAAISAHNHDPQAHLGENEAIEVHREAAVADHPAESIVNDKIRSDARSYTAIVSPGTDGNFDTIEGAVNYVAGLGGGDILLAAGTHYVSSDMLLPQTISLFGVSADVSTLHLNGNLNQRITIDYTGVTLAKTQRIEGLTINCGGGTGITNPATSSWWEHQLLISDCRFVGGTTYFDEAGFNIRFRDCDFACGTNPSIDGVYQVAASSCVFRRHGTTSVPKAFGGNPDDDIIAGLDITDCEFLSAGANNCSWIVADAVEQCRILDSTLQRWSTLSFIFVQATMSNCRVDLGTSSYIIFDGNGSSVIGCTLAGGAVNSIRLTSASTNSRVVGNYVEQGISNAGTNNILAGNV